MGRLWYNIITGKALPVDGGPPNMVIEVTAWFRRLGGYFFLLVKIPHPEGLAFSGTHGIIEPKGRHCQ